MKRKITLLAITILSSISCSATSYYWVGGSGNGSDFNNHWATTSGSSIFHNQVPQSGDNVCFDALSYSTSGQMVIIDQSIAQCAYTNLTMGGNTSFLWSGGSAFVSCISAPLPCTPPIITLNPNPISICTGSMAIFSMAANGSTLTYQWQVNQGAGFTNLISSPPYIGVTEATLSIAGVPVTMNGFQYRCLVSSDTCTITSNAVMLTVTSCATCTPPVITLHPNSSSFCEGSMALFSMAANDSSSTYQYQWQVNQGAGFTNLTSVPPYIGVTQPILNIAGVTSAMNGYEYRCVVANDNCISTSGPATLTVTSCAPCTPPIITLNPNPSSVCTGSMAIFSMAANGSTLTYQWQVNQGAGFTNLISTPPYIGVTQATLSIAGVPVTMNGFQYRCLVSSDTCTITSNAAMLSVSSCATCTPPVITLHPSSSSFCAGSTALFSMAANDSSSTYQYQWQVNQGAGFTNLTSVPPYIGVTQPILNIAGVTSAMNGYEYRCVVANDNCTSTSGPATLTVTSCAPCTPPIITLNPTPSSVCAGSMAVFSMGANDSSSTYQYQWQVNQGAGFTNLTSAPPYIGVTQPILNIAGVTSVMNGYQYRCVVTNNTCINTSGPATLTVLSCTPCTPPIITLNPSPSSICVDGNTVFVIAATGTSLTYQWQVNDGAGFINLISNLPYSGVTTNTLSITAVAIPLNGNQYRCVVSSDVCVSTSGPATLTVTSCTPCTPPLITNQPIPSSVCAGNTASFSVMATGTNLTYQWQVNQGAGFTNLFSMIPYTGVTTSLLSIAGVTTTMNGYQYRCVVSSDVCISTSGPVTLTVTSCAPCTPPVIMLNPNPVSACAGSTASFSVMATGTNLTYQWQVNQGAGFTNLFSMIPYTGVTTSLLSIAGVTTTMNGYQYRCVVSSDVCVSTSGPATLTVTSCAPCTPPVIMLNPNPVSACAGSTTSFSVMATGTNLTYQWQVNQGAGFTNLFSMIPYTGVTTSLLSIAGVTTTMNGYQYRCVVSSDVCISTSGPATLIVTSCAPCTPPVIMLNPNPVSACAGSTASFSVMATGTNLTYQWQVNQGAGFTNLFSMIPYTGVTTSLLSITGVTTTMNGYQYRCVVSSDVCVSISGPATLTVTSCAPCTPPVITNQPIPTSVCAGNTASFSLMATGTNLTYQWQVNQGAGFTDLSNMPPYMGVTQPMLNIMGVTIALNGYQYRCIVSNTCVPVSSSTSNAATLIVSPAPIVTVNSLTICSGQTAILTASGATTYTWTTGTGLPPLPPALPPPPITGNPISVSPLITTTYTVTGTTNGCSKTAIATVTVNPSPIVNAGQDATVISNTSVQLGSASFPALSYSWSPIAGLSNANVSNPTLVLQNNGISPQTFTYILTATNGQCGKSDTVLITILGSQTIPKVNPNQISDSAFTQNVIPCGVSPEYFKSLGLASGGVAKGGGNPISLSLPDDFPTNLIEHCGHFDVYYEDLLNTNAQVGYADPVFGADRRLTLCAVLTYVQSVFDFDNVPAGAPIRLHIDTSFAPAPGNPAPPCTNAFAFAGPHFDITGVPIVNGFVRDYAVNGTDPTALNQYHAELTTNFDRVFDPNCSPMLPINWHNTIDANIPNCFMDLYSVLLHEITHTMGWTSLVHINHGTNVFESTFAPSNIFSGIDAILQRGSVAPLNLNPLIVNAPNTPSINPLANTLPLLNNNFWVSPFAAPDNHPVYSGLLFPSWPGTFAERSILSHMDGQMWLYSIRSRVSPGDVLDYVMQPFGTRGVLRRTYTDVEINTLNNIGYTNNPNFPGIPNLPNLPPFSPKMVGYSNILNEAFPETIGNDFQLTNNIGSFQDINLATGNIDPENDPITLLPGSLVNIRGCGNGGNNHNQLTDLGNGVIRFTPRNNFYGRAQFGLKLFDGQEAGSYVIYTIDVVMGNNVNCLVGSNIILNGDLEEGTEVKRLGAEEVIDASQQEGDLLEEGKNGAGGIQFADCQPFSYLSNLWFPFGSGEIIRDSWINCNGTTYTSHAGSWNTSFPIPWGSNVPDSRNGIGDRYKKIFLNFNYFNLCSEMQHCNRYILEFDYFAQPNNIPNGATIPLTVGFTNAATYPAPAILENSFIHNITVINGSWQHVIIPFTYCDTDPATILNLRQSLFRDFNIDNLQLREDLTPSPLTIAVIPGSQTVCQGSSIILNSTVSNSLCTTTYLWTPGNQTTASITVAPDQTTTFTLTANDGCRTATANSTITVIPLPTMANVATATICSGGTLNLPLTSDITSTYTWIATENLNTTGESLTTQTASTLNNVIFNTTQAIQTVIYTVTPTSATGACVGAPQNVTITVNPLPTITLGSTPSVCIGATTANITYSATTGSPDQYSIDYDATANLAGFVDITNSVLTASPIVLTIPGGAVVATYNYTLSVNNSTTGCVSNFIFKTITLNPLPVVTATPSTNTICSGSVTLIDLLSDLTGTTYSWTVLQTGVSGASGASGFSGTSISQTLNATGLVQGTVVYTITPTANSCSGTPITVTIYVNPIPVATATPASQTFCSPGTTAIALTSDVAGTDFAWTVTQTDVSGAFTGNGSSIAQSLTATSPFTGFAVYTIIPTSNGCSGTPITVNINVNPTPTVSSANSTIICSGSPVGISLTSEVPSYFTWIATDNLNTTGESTTLQTGTVLNNTLTNNTASDQTVTYTVTPISAPDGCTGTPQTFTVTVQPAPTMTSANSATICTQGVVNIPLTSNITSTYTWIATNNTNTTGESTTLQTGNPLNNGITNNSAVVQTVTYMVTPTPTVGTCVGAPQIITVTVIPSPTVTNAPTATVCNGIATNIPLTSSVPSTFTWTIGNYTAGVIGGVVGGSGSSINQILFDPSNSGIATVEYIVTPTSIAGLCVGVPFTITVTINPLPVVTATPSSQTVCSGLPITIIALSNPNNLPGVTYSWTRNNTVALTGMATSGTGANISGTLINIATIQKITTFTITATANGCSSSTNATVIVKPTPATPTASSNSPVCEGNTIQLSTPTVAGATYSWSGPNSFASALKNPLITNAAITNAGIYSVTVTVGGCASAAGTTTVIVKPKPVTPIAGSNTPVCAGNTINLTTSTVAGATYMWTGPNSFASTLQNPTITNVTLANAGTYSVIVIVSACESVAGTTTVVVNPIPVATATPASQNICSGSITGITLASTIAGTTFTWTATQTGASGAAAGSGSTIAQTLTATGSVAGTAVYTITPKITATGCVGTPINVTITVKPKPIAKATPAAPTICSGSSTSIALGTVNNVLGTTFNWTVVKTGLSGGTPPGNGSTITQTLTTTGTVAGTAVYTVTPVANGCTGSPISVTVTVNPIPVAFATPSSQTICSGGTTNIALSTNVAGTTTYSWTATQSGVTGATAGNGVTIATIAQPLYTTGTAPGTVVYKITPIVNGCPGSQISVTVTVITSCCTNYNLITGAAGVVFYNANVDKMLPPYLSGFAVATGPNSYIVTGKSFSINGIFTVNKDLTLDNCNIKLGPNAKITITNGRRLTITNNSALYACSTLWDGIYFSGTGTQLKVNNNSSIEDAFNAIVSTSGGKFTIDNAILNKNYQSIVVNPYNGTTHPGTITRSKISCDAGATIYSEPGNFLKPPYGYLTSYSGITILGVKGAGGINIGNWQLANSGFPNIFYKLDNGIVSSASNVQVYNTIFLNDINGINAFSSSTANRFLTVGGVAISQSNSFLSCQEGLLVTSFMNLNAESNQFINSAYAAIDVINCKSRRIQAQNNTINNFGSLGISCVDVGNSTVSILSNKINQTALSPANNDKIGIQVQNVNPVPTVLTITGNLIDWTRLGIWLRNTTVIPNTTSTNNFVNVGFNTIRFSQTGSQINSSPFPYCGIKAEGADQVYLVSNTIHRGFGLATPTAGNAPKLQGIRIEHSKQFVAYDNAMHGMGNGITCSGNCDRSMMYCNSLKDCWDGFSLVGTPRIGNQYTINSQGIIQNSASDNKWGGTINKKISGTGMDVPTKWYYRTTFASMSPFPHLAIPNLSITPISVQAAIGYTCSGTLRSMQSQPSPADIREQKLGGIVKNQELYNHLPFETKFANSEFAFYSLVQDTLLNLGAPDDSIYQNFYTAMSNSNSGLFREVQNLSEQYDVPLAFSKNAAIAPSSLMESNRKAVNEIYLNTWLSGLDTFTVAQQTELENIAYQDPLQGGLAVYSARVLLKIEVYDGQTAPNKMLIIGTQAEQSLFGKFYPNPTNNNATLNYQMAKGQTAYLELFDIAGVKMAGYELDAERNQLTISCNSLQSGIYIYRIVTNGTIAGSGKLVVLK